MVHANFQLFQEGLDWYVGWKNMYVNSLGSSQMSGMLSLLYRLYINYMWDFLL